MSTELPARFFPGHNRFYNLKGSEFRKLARKYLTPHLKARGFEHATFPYYRRPGKHYVQVLDFHGNKYGGDGYVDTGVFIDFLPCNGLVRLRDPIDLYKLRSYDCELGRRIRLPNGDDTFDYGTTEEEAAETFGYMRELIEALDDQYLSLFRNFPEPFAGIEPEEVERNPPALARNDGGAYYGRSMLIIARIHLFMGNRDRATQFANHAIRRMSEDDSLNRGSEWLTIMFEKVKAGDMNFEGVQ